MKEIYEMPTAVMITFTATDIVTLSACVGEAGSLTDLDWAGIDFN